MQPQQDSAHCLNVHGHKVKNCCGCSRGMLRAVVIVPCEPCGGSGIAIRCISLCDCVQQPEQTLARPYHPKPLPYSFGSLI